MFRQPFDRNGYYYAVTAKGYKSVFYPETFNLQSGEEKSLEIELEPKGQNLFDDVR